MNELIVDLLKKTPGIVRTHQGIQYKRIDTTDYANLLRMTSIDSPPALGDWVRVKRGHYKGDVGKVAALHNWGVELYLVPRINTQQAENSPKLKATTTVPDAKLFYPKDFPNNTSLNLQGSNGSYTINNLILVRGLVRKGYDYHSISQRVNEMPWKHYSMFLLTNHPEISISNIPHPQEWTFADGDEVIVSSFDEKGILDTIEPDYAVVELPGHGLQRVPWHVIQKFFKIGDFVGISSGPHHGTNGWVIHIEENKILIADKKTQIDADFTEAIQVRY